MRRTAPLLRRWKDLTIVFGLATSHSLATPLLEVKAPDNKVLLVASTHLGTGAVPKDPQLEAAIKSADTVCFENDPADTELPKNIQVALLLNPRGKRLENIVGKELYQKTLGYIDQATFGQRDLGIFSPYAAAGFINLSAAPARNLQASLRPEYSVDSYVLDLAQKNNVRTTGIEDPDALIDSFHALSDKEWKAYLSDALDLRACDECMARFSKNYADSYAQNDDYTYAYDKLKQAYSDKPSMFAIYEKFFFLRRNRGLAENIAERALKGKQCDVIVVGSGHFGGKNGIVNLLRQKGFVVKSLH